jgi:hypothetical protein
MVLDGDVYTYSTISYRMSFNDYEADATELLETYGAYICDGIHDPSHKDA